MPKALLLALAISGGLSLLVWAMPDLIILGYIMLILPGVVLSLMPTCFLYLCAFSVGYYFARQQGPVQASFYGLAALAVLALGVPLALNRESESLLAEERARQRQPAQKVALSGRVAIDMDRAGLGDPCSDLCQILLFQGTAQEVVVRNLRSKAAQAYRLQKGDCNVDLPKLDKMLQASLSFGGNPKRASELAESSKARIASGDCILHSESFAKQEDFTIRWVDEYSDYAFSPLRLEARGPWNRGVELHVAGRLVGRQTRSNLSLLSLPLHLEPISNGLGFRGWRWARSGLPREESKLDRLAMLATMTTTNLDLPATQQVGDLRRHLDLALANPSGPNTAFVLLPAYYKNLREEGFEVSDRARLARLIQDPRVTDFSYFNWSEKERKNVGPVLRDAMLQRLLYEARNAKELPRGSASSNVFPGLAYIAARLGPGTYAGDVPLLDELIAAVPQQYRLADLIPRLAEQGNAGVEKLVHLAEAYASRGHREIDGVRVGLCAAVPHARPLLPRLRALQGNFSEGYGWRGMLIALGAQPSEFRHPNGRDQAAYEKQLLQEARRCLEGKARI